ncbi:MAG TPA: c-type cytochrome, partial [Pirellulales bacterium]
LPIGQAQGLLWAFDSLYVVVNGSAAQGSGLYRCTDSNKDGELDKVTLLKKLNGGGEHGPHAVRLGPDGKSLWLIAGNHTDPPQDYAKDSPVKNFAEDHLLPRNPDGNGHATGRMAPGGWIAKTDENGKEWTIISAGYRNPYDIDFNTDGEIFTYDADMEWDTGAPWYRATRVNHGTSGSEFGWRFGTGKWPDYYVDSLGAVTDIGLGSPTGVEFGTNAKFPAKYQQAFYICDWTYGKLYAVHMKPVGSTYTASFETFVEGRPLPLTDVTINTDGLLYFTIGGRGTQSGLYRVSYTGKESTAPVKAIADPAATAARELRHKLEAFHGKVDPAAVEFAWPHLNSRDRALRFAARVAIEWQPVDTWKAKALAETKPTASILALCALARSGGKDAALEAAIVDKLNALPFNRLTEEQLLDALRVYQLTFIRQNGANPKAMTEATPPTTPEIASKATAALSPLFPSSSEAVNRELLNVLVYLEAPGTAERALAQLQKSLTQQDQFAYAFILRNLKTGWTPELRKAYFGWLNLAEKKYRGGNSFVKFLQQVRRDAVAKLTPDEQVAFKDAIEAPPSEEAMKLETTRQFVHNWQMPDLRPLLAKVESGRSFEKGKVAFEAAQCAKCHRFAGTGGDTGPDITSVGNKFTPEYILEAITEPSKVVSDQYKNVIIETVDGQVYSGRIINEADGVLTMRTDPFARELLKIKKDDVATKEDSPLSEMPQGLINVLTQDEILDLVAYLRAAGNQNDKAFKPAK